jgi:hypothetical protein
MERIGFFETKVQTYNTARFHIPIYAG